MARARGDDNVGLAVTIALVLVAAVVLFVWLFAWRGTEAETGEPLAGGSDIAGPEITSPETTSTTLLQVPAQQTIGSSIQGRPIELHTFSSGSWRVLVIGGVHGDEYGGPVTRKFLQYLQEHPEAVPADAFVQVIPSANPDGEEAGTRGNVNKVDLNRNLPSENWRENLNAGDRPTSGLTGGPSPASEPETKALLSVLGDDWDVVISLHSSGGIIDPDGNGVGLVIAERMSAACGMPVSGLDYQQYITGSLGVFMPERYQVPVITVELNSTDLSEVLRDALLSALKPI